MNKLISASIFCLAVGILTSVTILSLYQVLFAVPLIYYTFLAFKNKDFKLPTSSYWVLGFALVAVISLILNLEIVPEPAKNFGKVKYYLYGACGIYAFRAWFPTLSEKTKNVLTTAFLLSIIIAGIAAIYSYFVNLDHRARGFTDTMRYGYGSGMLLLTILGAILHRSKLKFFDVRIGVAAFIIGFVGMYLTYTRGALLGFVCGLPFLFYYYNKKYAYWIGGGAVALVAVLGGFYLFGNVQNNSGSRFVLSKNNESDIIRKSQWKAAVIATQERPVLGWGLSNFHTQLKRIKNDYDLDAKYYDDSHAHNLFLEISSGTGLIGLFFFLAWIVTWAMEMFRKDDVTRALVIPFCVSWVVSSQFEVTFDANNASMIFFLYAASLAFRSDVKA